MSENMLDAYKHTMGEYIVFNIGGNKYRLITVIRFPLQVIFVRSFLTHKQYENESNWKKGVV